MGSDLRKRVPIWILVAALVSVGVVASGLFDRGANRAGFTGPDPGSVFDPTAAGEALPDGYRQLLRRDDIAPEYDPRFTSADAVDWPGESLVIGLEGSETTKAYPVTFLNQREMVIDDLDGLPVLVSW